jgi:peptidoglycan hydrolase CwlO-like protein
MLKIKSLIFTLLAFLILTTSALLTGCSSCPTDEQLAELETLKAEVSQLMSTNSGLDAQISQVQSDINSLDNSTSKLQADLDAARKRCP